MKVTIKAVTPGKNGRPPAILVDDIDGSEQWKEIDPKCLPFVKKGQAEATFSEQDNKFTLVKMDSTSVQPSYKNGAGRFNTSFPTRNDPEKEKKIIRQTCLKGSIELWCGTVKTEVVGDIIPHILDNAEKMEKWVNRE